jgi:hypothetical protein
MVAALTEQGSGQQPQGFGVVAVRLQPLARGLLGDRPVRAVVGGDP